MRWSLAFVALLLTLTGTATAHEEISFVHYQPVPCAVACPLWDIGSDDRVCNGPQIPGSYDQTHLAWTTEDDGAVADLVLNSFVDHDMVLCTETEPSKVIFWAIVPMVDYRCTGLGSPWIWGLGCQETAHLSRRAVLWTSGGETDRFFVRTFNWADVAPAEIRATGPVKVTDSSFESLPLTHPR
jgi:hypothetical protein